MGYDNGEYRIKIMPEAEEQLDEIYGYVALVWKSLAAARRLNRKLKGAIMSLNKFPNRGFAVRKQAFEDKNIRFIVAGNFKVFYRIVEKEKEIHVVAIVYQHRDYSSLNF